MLLIAHGRVVAGVDLGKLQPADVQVSSDGRSVVLTLPPAEILSAGLDEERTRIYSRESGKRLGVFTQAAEPHLEAEARRRGLQQVLHAACEDGILRRANEDGAAALRTLLTLAGFASVQVATREPAAACAAPR